MSQILPQSLMISVKRKLTKNRVNFKPTNSSKSFENAIKLIVDLRTEKLERLPPMIIDINQYQTESDDSLKSDSESENYDKKDVSSQFQSIPTDKVDELFESEHEQISDLLTPLTPKGNDPKLAKKMSTKKDKKTVSAKKSIFKPSKPLPEMKGTGKDSRRQREKEVILEDVKRLEVEKFKNKLISQPSTDSDSCDAISNEDSWIQNIILEKYDQVISNFKENNLNLNIPDHHARFKSSDSYPRNVSKMEIKSSDIIIALVSSIRSVRFMLTKGESKSVIIFNKIVDHYWNRLS